MSAWIECMHCKGRGSVRFEKEHRIYSSFTYLERITARNTCPHCDGEGKVLIE